MTHYYRPYTAPPAVPIETIIHQDDPLWPTMCLLLVSTRDVFSAPLGLKISSYRLANVLLTSSLLLPFNEPISNDSSMGLVGLMFFFNDLQITDKTLVWVEQLKWLKLRYLGIEHGAEAKYRLASGTCLQTDSPWSNWSGSATHCWIVPLGTPGVDSVTTIAFSPMLPSLQHQMNLLAWLYANRGKSP